MDSPQYPELGLAPAALGAPIGDDELVRRIRGGEYALFEIVMRRHNQQLYRAARAIMKSDDEVEDILQQAYLNAFTHLDQFEARARLSTWLTRIVIHEAYARRRHHLRRTSRTSGAAAAGSFSADTLAASNAEGASVTASTSSASASPSASESVASPLPSPEHQAYASELQRVIEGAIDELPEPYRLVFMLRDVEGMSTAEAGEALGLGLEAVKTRLHRARAMLRRAVAARVGSVAADAFQFHAPRCDRVVFSVMHRLPTG
jgi:RNA polymerase sigma-70 factor (ECF subfamily)